MRALRLTAALIAACVACRSVDHDSALPESSSSGPARFYEYPETDFLRYEIALVLDPVKRTAAARIEYEARAIEDLKTVRLDLMAGEQWLPEFRQGDELLEFHRDGDRISLALHKPVAAGDTFSFSCEISGTPPDGLYFGETRRGDPCAYLDHYSVRARGWLPCEDHPADRAHFALTLAVPAGFDAVMTGAQRPASIEPWATRGWSTWESETASEIPAYLLGVAVASFARLEEQGDERIVPHFLYEADVEVARPALVYHARWIALLEQAIGPYPYAKYCVVQIPTRWGGMELAGNTFLSERVFEGHRGGIGTLAHELAHMWFGDGVGYADWYEVWLSEGFASYFGPWLDAQTGGPSLEQAMAGQRDRWLSSDVGHTLPVRWRGYENPDAALNANTYPKGAWILHMLRVELGDEVFFAALRDYYARHVGAAARTPDLVAAFERASGRELDWYFEQWLDRPGCPELVCEWGDDGLVVRQVQEGPAFEFLLPLAWTTVDGEPRSARFRVHARETSIGLDGAPVRDGQIDPNVELLFAFSEETGRR